MVRMLEEFATWKERIVDCLGRAVKERIDLFREVHPLGPEVLDRILRYTKRGKMIRGGLVCLGQALTNGTNPEDGVVAGAAIELFESSLLIHDDIMDRDTIRRGAPSLHCQFGERAEHAGFADSVRIGEAMGICAGDIAIFFAYELLAGLETAGRIPQHLIAECSQELRYVGLAQMSDVLRGAATSSTKGGAGNGFWETNDPVADIFRLYKYKTARYTFSLPLVVGATIAGVEPPTIRLLRTIGEDLGILYQLKDDEIGLFGMETTVGKPVGSDIREGKKTLFHHYLFSSADPTEIGAIEPLFGNPTITDADVRFVCELIERKGIRQKVTKHIEAFASRAEEGIAHLDGVDRVYKTMLLDLVHYSIHRER